MRRELQTFSYRKYWPLREFVGKDTHGNKVAKEVFRDMTTGEVHIPANGWNGEPPPLPSGEKPPDMAASDAYKINYARIFGHD